MLKSKKHVFWEAFLIAIVIFILGIFLGIAYESKTADKINEYYSQSEISLMDIFAMNNLINNQKISCDLLIQTNIEFADKVYEEAKLLKDYEKPGEITQGFEIAHKRYDLLRTILWINSIKTKELCTNNNFNVVVYLYNLNEEDIKRKSEQLIWEKVLYDLKQEKGNEILLIPIAINKDIISLQNYVKELKISQFPVVVIDNKKFIYEIESVKDLEKYLDNQTTPTIKIN